MTASFTLLHLLCLKADQGLGVRKSLLKSEDLRLFLTYMGRVTVFSLCGRPSLPVPALTLVCSKPRSVLRRNLTPRLLKPMWFVYVQHGAARV